jgi:hypothetical protein
LGISNNSNFNNQLNKRDMENTNVASFRRALDEVPYGKYKEVRKRLRMALNIRTEAALNYKVRGVRPVTLPQVYEVEKIFKDYGVTVEWGCQKEDDEKL